MAPTAKRQRRLRPGRPLIGVHFVKQRKQRLARGRETDAKQAAHPVIG